MSPDSRSASKTCAGCGQTIQGMYTTALDKSWHPQHFTCQVCGEVLAYSSFYEKQGKAYCESCYHQRFSPRCASCNQPIRGQYITALEKTWHKEHFVCAHCGKGFQGGSYYPEKGAAYCAACHKELFGLRCTSCKQLLVGKSYHEHDKKPYCDDCYHQNFSPRCAICAQPIRSEYFTNYWGESYCSSHEDKYPRCSCCGRLISQNSTGGGLKYSDGRSICNRCNATAVTDAGAAEQRLAKVKQGLGKLGLDCRNLHTPIRLVNQDELTKLSTHAYAKRPNGMTRTQISTRNGDEVGREVQEILILYGLPDEFFASVSAHELAHAWLFMNHFPDLSPVVEEGICELVEVLWLKSQNTPQARYRIYLNESQEDSVYGGGLKAASKVMEKYNLMTLLDYVRKNKRFPG